ncbi:hypothetical protein [Nocardia sp. alder85J]|uniref:hypothetical protein n=1 Tax=Nocardia sp. alder85J TaxID=2862949 RepID=UPI002252104C|nr:hypothetical protein [Nocardia sp. alder85J]MCX4097710.1 hypothetical protein [Nocardia sp. alder85J]
MTTILVGAALALVALGAIFPWLSRWGGVLLIIDSMGGLLLHLGQGSAYSLMWLVIGLAAWLVGHLVYAHRDGFWRSWLAFQIFRLPGLRLARP